MARLDAGPLAEAVRRAEAELEVQLPRALAFIGDKVVNDARRTTLFRDRTSALRRSILRGPVEGSVSAGDLRIELRAGGARMVYAAAIHDGSRAHDIVPKRRHTLRFVKGSDFVFTRRVRHPGTAARPFLTEAIEANLGFAERALAQAHTAAFARAGLA